MPYQFTHDKEILHSSMHTSSIADHFVGHAGYLPMSSRAMTNHDLIYLGGRGEGQLLVGALIRGERGGATASGSPHKGGEGRGNC